MSNPSVTLIKGDYGYDINFTITNAADDTVIDLTSKTVQFRIKKPGETAILDKACTLVVAASGTCKYTVASGDITDIGTFLGELEVQTGSTSRVTIAPIDITIKQQLG